MSQTDSSLSAESLSASSATDTDWEPSEASETEYDSSCSTSGDSEECESAYHESGSDIAFVVGEGIGSESCDSEDMTLPFLFQKSQQTHHSTKCIADHTFQADLLEITQSISHHLASTLASPALEPPEPQIQQSGEVQKTSPEVCLALRDCNEPPDVHVMERIEITGDSLEPPSENEAPNSTTPLATLKKTISSLNRTVQAQRNAIKRLKKSLRIHRRVINASEEREARSKEYVRVSVLESDECKIRCQTLRHEVLEYSHRLDTLKNSYFTLFEEQQRILRSMRDLRKQMVEGSTGEVDKITPAKKPRGRPAKLATRRRRGLPVILSQKGSLKTPHTVALRVLYLTGYFTPADSH